MKSANLEIYRMFAGIGDLRTWERASAVRVQISGPVSNVHECPTCGGLCSKYVKVIPSYDNFSIHC